MISTIIVESHSNNTSFYHSLVFNSHSFIRSPLLHSCLILMTDFVFLWFNDLLASRTAQSKNFSMWFNFFPFLIDSRDERREKQSALNRKILFQNENIKHPNKNRFISFSVFVFVSKNFGIQWIYAINERNDRKHFFPRRAQRRQKRKQRRGNDAKSSDWLLTT